MKSFVQKKVPLLSALVIILGSAVFVVPANASTSGTSSKAHNSQPPFTITSNGWIDYNNTEASLLPLNNAQTLNSTGTFDAGGNCNVVNPQPSIPYGTVAVVSETSYNPTLCKATFLQGEVTSQVASSIGITTGSAMAPSPGAPVSPKLKSAGAGRTNKTGTITPLNEYNVQVFSKAEYVDPVDITITSLAENLSYNYDSATGIIGGNSAYPVGYHWAYDIWGGAAATSSITLNDGSLDVVANGYYQQTNVDFQAVVMLLLGPLAYASCTELGQTTVFTHDLFIGGAAGPEIAYSNADSKSGGCANLTHWTAEYGTGSTS